MLKHPVFKLLTEAMIPLSEYLDLLMVKVDFVKHHFFKLIDKPIVEAGIRMFGDRDIIPMKIFAILKRAQKKDFWDVAELLKHHNL
jgi:hypothetical protein